MKKNIFVSVICIIAAQMLQAAPVNRTQALRMAEAFLSNNNRMKMYAPHFETIYADDEIKPYYIFNMSDNGGFVIVSGDDAVCPILGYSYIGSINTADMPENLQTWLDGYACDIRKIQKMNLPKRMDRKNTEEAWDTIPALVSALWNQEKPFNNQCPMTTNGRHHRPTGCVATAMAQVMYYHKWPVEETAAVKGYTYMDEEMYGGDGSEIVLDDLEPTVFDWDSMLDSYEDEEYSDTSADAVAKLLKYVGYSVEMMYGQKASAALAQDIPKALVHTFGYKKTARLIYRASYDTQNEWESLIYKELSEGRPVIYSGITKTGSGHEFVCDGYEDKYFHINWGWGGMSNGYFMLAVLDPNNQGTGGAGSGASFSEFQTAVIGVEKPIEDDVLRAADIEAEPGKETVLGISLDNKRKNYTSVQFDIQLPEGIDVACDGGGTAKVSINEERSENGNHLVGVNKTDARKYRVVVYSPQNSLIKGSQGELVKMILNVGSSVSHGIYKAGISNVMICDKELVTRQLADTDFSINVSDISGIDNVTCEINHNPVIYTVAGVRISGSVNNLKKGIYIIDGKKTVVR